MSMRASLCSFAVLRALDVPPSTTIEVYAPMKLKEDAYEISMADAEPLQIHPVGTPRSHRHCQQSSDDY